MTSIICMNYTAHLSMGSHNTIYHCLDGPMSCNVLLFFFKIGEFINNKKTKHNSQEISSNSHFRINSMSLHHNIPCFPQMRNSKCISSSRLLSPTWFQWMRGLFTDHTQTTLRCKYTVQFIYLFTLCEWFFKPLCFGRWCAVKKNLTNPVTLLLFWFYWIQMCLLQENYICFPLFKNTWEVSFFYWQGSLPSHSSSLF